MNDDIVKYYAEFFEQKMLAEIKLYEMQMNIYKCQIDDYRDKAARYAEQIAGPRLVHTNSDPPDDHRVETG